MPFSFVERLALSFLEYKKNVKTSSLLAVDCGADDVPCSQLGAACAEPDGCCAAGKAVDVSPAVAGARPTNGVAEPDAAVPSTCPTSDFDNDSLDAYLKWLKLQRYFAKFGKGFDSDALLLLRCEHWLEAADEHHRHGSNLRPYFDYWVSNVSDGCTERPVGAGSSPCDGSSCHAAEPAASAGAQGLPAVQADAPAAAAITSTSGCQHEVDAAGAATNEASMTSVPVTPSPATPELTARRPVGAAGADAPSSSPSAQAAGLPTSPASPPSSEPSPGLSETPSLPCADNSGGGTPSTAAAHACTGDRSAAAAKASPSAVPDLHPSALAAASARQPVSPAVMGAPGPAAERARSIAAAAVPASIRAGGQQQQQGPPFAPAPKAGAGAAPPHFSVTPVLPCNKGEPAGGWQKVLEAVAASALLCQHRRGGSGFAMSRWSGGVADAARAAARQGAATGRGGQRQRGHRGLVSSSSTCALHRLGGRPLLALSAPVTPELSRRGSVGVALNTASTPSAAAAAAQTSLASSATVNGAALESGCGEGGPSSDPESEPGGRSCEGEQATPSGAAISGPCSLSAAAACSGALRRKPPQGFGLGAAGPRSPLGKAPLESSSSDEGCGGGPRSLPNMPSSAGSPGQLGRLVEGHAWGQGEPQLLQQQGQQEQSPQEPVLGRLSEHQQQEQAEAPEQPQSSSMEKGGGSALRGEADDGLMDDDDTYDTYDEDEVENDDGGPLHDFGWGSDSDEGDGVLEPRGTPDRGSLDGAGSESQKLREGRYNFFLWLDHGEGKHLDLAALGVPRAKLEAERVRYLSSDELPHYEVVVDKDDGLLKYRLSGQLLHTFPTSEEGICGAGDAAGLARHGAGQEAQRPQQAGAENGLAGATVPTPEAAAATEAAAMQHDQQQRRQQQAAAPAPAVPQQAQQHGQQKQPRQQQQQQQQQVCLKQHDQKWIWVVAPGGRLYVAPKVRGQFHHSSFLCGAAVLAAGNMLVDHGKLVKLTADSGHYWPGPDHFRWFFEHLSTQGADLRALEGLREQGFRTKH